MNHKIQKATPVQQQHKKDVDINNIVRRLGVGEIPNVNKATPMYVDNSEMPTYQEMLNIVVQHEQNFASLPAKIRAEFHNNAEELVTFLSNPENKEKALELGFNPEIYLEKEEDSTPPEKLEETTPVEKETEPTK